ncbi:MAG: PilZ domain-containing protein [Deltaproteobacteria bacterium]|nr:PilZ domain-containing protein [Deltaproteobacteria bacterium]
MSDTQPTRRFARVDLEARVQVTSLEPLRDPATGVPVSWDTDELCATLSVGGAFIPTADPPPPGNRLLLQIHLPSGESIETVGRVAWTRYPLGEAHQPGVGVEFVTPTGEARGALERLLVAAQKNPQPES